MWRQPESVTETAGLTDAPKAAGQDRWPASSLRAPQRPPQAARREAAVRLSGAGRSPLLFAGARRAGRSPRSSSASGLTKTPPPSFQPLCSRGLIPARRGLFPCLSPRSRRTERAAVEQLDPWPDTTRSPAALGLRNMLQPGAGRDHTSASRRRSRAKEGGVGSSSSALLPRPGRPREPRPPPLGLGQAAEVASSLG